MKRSLTSRPAAAAVLAAAAALVLSACGSSGGSASGDATSSSSPTPSATSSPAASTTCGDYGPGAVSNAVKVSGAFGKVQQADVGKGVTATDLQRTVLTRGKGATSKPGQFVSTLVTVFRGSDGQALGSQPLTILVGDPGTLPPAFIAGADCVPFGSRVVVTAPVTDVYGEAGFPSAGLQPDDTVVIVTDLIGKAQTLTPAAWKKDVPKVAFASDGTPTVTLPDTKPPAGLLLKVLRQGDGATVHPGDSVTLDYQGTSWNTGKVFDQSYGSSPATFRTDQVVTGFGAALVGQKVGTRLIVTIPPKYAYGAKGSGSQLAGQTLVFVVEIRDTAS